MSAARPLAVTNARLLDGGAVGLRAADGSIAALGADVAPEPDDDVLDAGGGLLVPPLLNGHTHAAMTLFRGTGGDLPLMPWLEERIFPVEARLESEDVYWGARLACLEMIRTGTTRFWDMYWHAEETSRAVADAGIRATLGAPFFDKGRDATEMRAEARETLAALSDAGERVSPALAPHSIYMVSDESLSFLAALAAEHEVPVQIHLAETAGEVKDCLSEHGHRTAAHLDSLGLLGERTLIAHGVWLDSDELELIAERSATVVTNPVANMKLAVGATFDYPAAREAGLALGLGTDGAGSNDSLDLMADLKTFALVQKLAAGDATALPAADAWRIATGAASPLLGATPLAPGEPADFLLLDPDAPDLALGDPTTDLVFAASGSVVDTTVVAGRVLMRGGEQPERAEIVARAREQAIRLGL